jgi:predicted metal-dependent peptidase
MSEYSLEQDVFRLLRSEPFFAALSRSVNKHASNSVATAGVRITDDGNFDLAYNTEFFKSLPDEQRRGVLKHEFYHLIFEHCFARNPDGKKVSKLWNAATDMAINCHLKGELPDMCWMPEKMGFQDHLTAEQYAKLLKDKFPESGEGDGEGQSGIPGDEFDDHGGWGGEASQQMKEAAAIAKERLREAMKKGVEEASRQSNGFGNMHQDVKKAIMAFVNGTIDWRAVLRNFIGQSQRSSRSNTIKRINKRFPYIHPGRKTDRAAHIAIAIDQSGSVSDEMLSLFFGELNNLSKLVTFTVVPFDTETNDKLVYQWKNGQKHGVQRVMEGSTNFDAPTQWANKHPEIDGLIIATDMQAPAPKPCRVRRLWVTTPENKDNSYFQTNELVIGIKKNNN